MRDNASGVSTVELLVVIAIVAAVSAAGMPLISSAVRAAELQAAAEAAANAVKRASAEAASGGAGATLSAGDIPRGDGVAINPAGVAPPHGTVVADRVGFQRQTGTALVGGRPARAAIVVADAADPGSAFAIVAGPRGAIERHRSHDGGWGTWR